jgi:hypothetical protein
VSRLKKVQGKKKRDHAAAELKKQELADAEGGDPPLVDGEGDEADTNLLSSKDEDVIF